MKVTTWNIKFLSGLIGQQLSSNEKKRKEAVIQELRDLDPAVLCIVEGPNGNQIQNLKKFIKDVYGTKKVLITSPDNKYGNRVKDQWVWFVVDAHLEGVTQYQDIRVWQELTGEKSWKVNYWGSQKTSTYFHSRQPQVIRISLDGQEYEFIGLHLKSKFTYNGWARDWKKGIGTSQYKKALEAALKSRIKLATQAANVRKYINARFEQVENPSIIALGDLNDGPGKEFFEQQYLFFDLLNNIQGTVFEGSRFLNHALFDAPDNLRWSAYFEDIIDPNRNPKILLDHILFTQALVNGTSPLQIKPNAGLIEHEIHDRINATVNSKQKTSDHKPISVILS